MTPIINVLMHERDGYENMTSMENVEAAIGENDAVRSAVRCYRTRLPGSGTYLSVMVKGDE